MGRRTFGAALALGVALLLGHAGERALARPPERDLSGAWELAGWNMGADRAGPPSYRGKILAERKDKDTYVVTWEVNGKVVNRGVGIYDPRTDVFAGAYAIRTREGSSPGVAVWRISADGKVMDCVGTFMDKVGDVAWEEWRRPD